MTITTSRSFEFSPTLGETVLEAFSRIGVRGSEITQSHMFNARLSANLLLSEISNSQPNLWQVAPQSIPMLQGIGTYSVPAETVMILDAYITYGSPSTDRYISPISRTEYLSLPNKSQQGFPNQFWFDRLVSPTITFFFVPDGNGPYVATYYSVRQTQDANLPNGQTVEIPYRWLDAYAAGLAWKLSEKYAPEREDKMLMKYQRALTIAQGQDIENTPMYITPQIGGYFA